MGLRAGLHKGLAIAVLAAAASAAAAGEADVTAVEVEQTAPGVYAFDVTVAHGDEGWDHYADRWDVLGPEGGVLASRVLAHPHVDEQPFTRSLAGVAIPEGVDEVTVIAHDSVHGAGGAGVTVALPD